MNAYNPKEVADLADELAELRKELEHAINRTSSENGSNTPDFILAEFLVDCLVAWNKAVKAREEWYGNEHTIVNHLSSEQAENDRLRKAIEKAVVSIRERVGGEMGRDIADDLERAKEARP